MPGKLFTNDLAQLYKESGNKHYRPSNGEEGMLFMALWCEQCSQDENEDCPILAATFYCNANDKEYPREWTFDDDGQPCCTAFGPAGDPAV